MAVKLKLTRLGSKKHPFYRVVAANNETVVMAVRWNSWVTTTP